MSTEHITLSNTKGSVFGAHTRKNTTKAKWSENLSPHQYDSRPQPHPQSEQYVQRARCKLAAVFPLNYNLHQTSTREGSEFSVRTIKPERDNDSTFLSRNFGFWSEIQNYSKNCENQNYSMSSGMEWSRKTHKGAGKFAHLCPSALSLICLAVLCVVATLPYSVNCIAIKSQSDNALNNYDSHDNTQIAANHIIAHHRTRARQEEPDSRDNSVDATLADDENLAEDSGTVVNPKDNNGTCLTDKCIEATGYLSNSMNLKANPCEDFYQYACGRWIQDHPIPQFSKSWSHFQRVFYTIREELIEQLNSKEKFEIATKNQTVFTKLYDFFHGCKNQKQRDITGYTSLLKLLTKLGGWPMIDDHWDKSLFNWETSYIILAKLNLFFFLRIEPMVDLLDPNQTIIKIGPPYKTKENIVNLGIFKMYRKEPEYSYSFEGRRVNVAPTNPDPPQDKLKMKYKEVIKELKLHSMADPSHLNLSEFEKFLDKNLAEIYELQDRLESHAKPMNSVETYESNYSDYLKNISEIQKLAGFNIVAVVNQMFGISLSDNQKILVPDIGYIIELGKVFKDTETRILANYFATNVVMNMASHTTSKMVGLLITKLDAPEILQNICFDHTSQFLPELLGKLYLDGVLGVTLKWHEDVNTLIKYLNVSFNRQLEGNKWMDQTTTAEAIAKLNRMSMNIGFPDWFNKPELFTDYFSKFNNITQEDYFSSVVNVNEASQMLSIQELSDRLHHSSALTSWPGHKQIIDVNAFYFFTSNGVYIPVAIAQYPFYEQGLPKAITFGSMGMIIGHEMTHALDNTGRLYDSKGALSNWWSKETSERFRNKTDCFVKQYSNYEVGSLKINGVGTLAENIADNGGLSEAYRAFKIYQNDNREESLKRLPGAMSQFTTDQLFFISFANMWCSHMETSVMESEIHKNAHSPPNIRVIGSLANFLEFSEAFSCKAGSKMNPEEKCVLW